MARSKVYRTGRARIAFNMTPMIDCTFQLIIFFILTTQLASQDYVRIQLPEPDRNVAKEYEVEKLVVNVVPYTKEEIAEDKALRGQAREYRISVNRYDRDDVEGLVRQLVQARRQREVRAAAEGKAAAEAFTVELRADKSVHFVAVEPVLQALQEAKLPKMYITAVRGRGL